MASTVTRVHDTIGGGARGEVNAIGSRALSIGVYNIAFGNPYVVGGENIASIWDDFKEVLAVVAQPAEATVADRREYSVDLVAKKLLMFTAANTESTAIDQSAVSIVRLLVFGYR